MEIAFAVLGWIVCGIAGAMVAAERGASGCLWFGLGFLLGPFGLVLSLVAGDGRRCPACRKNIHPEATKCPYCQSSLVEASIRLTAEPDREVEHFTPSASQEPSGGDARARFGKVLAFLLLFAVIVFFVYMGFLNKR